MSLGALPDADPNIFSDLPGLARSYAKLRTIPQLGKDIFAHSRYESEWIEAPFTPPKSKYFGRFDRCLKRTGLFLPSLKKGRF
jgi:hypothetical protein